MASGFAGAKTEFTDETKIRLWCDPTAPLDEASSKLIMAKTTLNILQMQFKPALDCHALQKEEVCKLLDIAFELVRKAVRTDHTIVLNVPIEAEEN